VWGQVIVWEKPLIQYTDSRVRQKYAKRMSGGMTWGDDRSKVGKTIPADEDVRWR